MSLLFIPCALQFESFYSIFTTEQQDHVKSVEYLRNNYRPTQELHNRFVFKSAVKDAWHPDPMADEHASSTDTEASKGERKLKDWMLRTYSMPLNAYKGYLGFLYLSIITMNWKSLISVSWIPAVRRPIWQKRLPWRDYWCQTKQIKWAGVWMLVP